MRADNELLRRADETLTKTTRLCIQIAVAAMLIGAALEIALAIGVGHCQL
jgi:hypothetical protein